MPFFLCPSPLGSVSGGDQFGISIRDLGPGFARGASPTTLRLNAQSVLAGGTSIKNSVFFALTSGSLYRFFNKSGPCHPLLLLNSRPAKSITYLPGGSPSPKVNE